MKTISLELSSAEAAELKLALDAHLREEEAVVVRTDNPEFRHALVADYEMLERIRERLGGLLGSEASQDSAAQ